MQLVFLNIFVFSSSIQRIVFLFCPYNRKQCCLNYSLVMILLELDHILLRPLVCLLSQNCLASLTYNLTGVSLCTYLTALLPVVTDIQLGRSLAVYFPDSS